MTTAIILLAAGESARLGQPKQLVEWEGKPLLRRMVEVALGANLGGPVIVVLGAVDEPCRRILDGLEVIIVRNEGWKTGMGGSIAKGVAAISEPAMGVLLMLCDQPFVSPGLLRSLEAEGPGKRISASRYAGHLGPPAWFAPATIPDLLSLEGSPQGARELIRGESSIAWVDFPEAAFDIDTPADLTARNT